MTAAELEAPEFIARLQQGDKRAFSQLVQAHHTRLIATACSLLNQADAEEAVQEAWISAHRAITKFEGRSQLRTWLTRIVINHAKMRLRKQGREIQLDTTDTADALAPRFDDDGHWSQPPLQWDLGGPDALLTRDELRHCMQKNLEKMPENQRLVLELKDLQGMPFDDICNMLDISASNVRVLLHRARARLFQLVDRFQETGEC